MFTKSVSFRPGTPEGWGSLTAPPLPLDPVVLDVELLVLPGPPGSEHRSLCRILLLTSLSCFELKDLTIFIVWQSQTPHYWFAFASPPRHPLAPSSHAISSPGASDINVQPAHSGQCPRVR